MKILVLGEEFPYPLNTGGRIRTFSLFSRLAQKHEVRFLAYGDEDSDSYRYCDEAGLLPIAVPPQVPSKHGLVFYMRLLANLFSQLPYVVTSHYSEVYRSHLQTELEQRPADIVAAAWTPYATFFSAVPKGLTLITSHNIEADIWKRYYATETSLHKKWYIGTQAAKMRRFEKSVFRQANAVTAVSAADASAIRKTGSEAAVEVIENGVALDYFTTDSVAEIIPERLVFTGSMDWRPNQDAAEYFVNDIFPRLREKRPDLEAVFVGREPPDHIRQLGDIPGITITGTVDDIRPYIREAAVYIVPLRVGGGSRLKILEALALKKPVVSTSVGAEGLAITHDKDILLADSPEQFAAAVESLLNDRARAERLGTAGRELVVQRYGWDRLATELEKFLLKLVSER